MSMQQPENIQRGEAGEKSVELFFIRIGWGPLSTGKQDLGTDLFVQIRDNNRIDLRMMIGVQVKTGNGWFCEPADVDGRSGWWFRESHKKHADYWINHHIPHILVLQTQDESTRVWVSLDARTIRDTGAGIKVFVPADQSLDQAHIGRWVDLAAEARRLVSFEGSRWTFSVTQLPADDWARHALIAPRLVSPHPNRGYSEPINWAEAIALCIEANPERWSYFAAQHESVPSPEEASTSIEPGWRLAAAIHGWVTDGNGALVSFDTSGASQAIRNARAVCLAISLADNDQAAEALNALDGEQDDEKVSADQAWLEVHRARILSETGQIDEAVGLLKDLIINLGALRSDVTVSAFRSAAIWTLYELTDRFDQDLSTVIPALDTAASWWRTQSTASGLESAAGRTFSAWAPDNSINIGASDVAHNELYASALAARLAGDHGSWRSAIALMAIVDLSTKRPQAARPLEALDSLRRAGDDRQLARAVSRIRDIGPLTDIVELLAQISPANMTRTSLSADLAALRVAGEYAATGCAREIIDFLLDALLDPAAFMLRFRLMFPPQRELLETLTGLISHSTETQQRRIMDFVLRLDDAASEILDAPLTKVLDQLDAQLFAEYRGALAERATVLTRDKWLARVIWKTVGLEHKESREAIHAALIAGDVRALSSLGSIEHLEPDEALAMVEKCKEAFEGYRITHNGLSVHSIDYSRLCTQLALLHPNSGAWDVLVDFLCEPTAFAGLKRQACKMLSENNTEIPEKLRLRLHDALRTLRTQPAPEGDRFDGMIPKIGGALNELFLELSSAGDPGEQPALAAMLTGDEQSRFDAVDYLSRRGQNELLLLTMTRDENFRVSHRSMLGLARLVCESVHPQPSIVLALTELLEADGEANVNYILGGLEAKTPAPEHVKQLLRCLQTHPSIVIRQRVNEILHAEEPSTA